MNIVKITDVCDFQGGTQPPKSDWIKDSKSGYIRMLQIRDFTQRQRNNIEYVKEKATLKTCNEDDILIGRYGASIGKICDGLKGAYNVALVKTIPNKKLLNRDFLLYVLKGDDFQNFIQNIGSRAAQAGFNKADLEGFQFPLPPLPQQQKIANILDAADALRQKDKALLAKYDELTQALFLDMFGDPVSNPKGWEKIELKKCTSKIGSGSTPRGGKETYLTEGIPLIRSLNIYDNEFKYKNLAFISQGQADKLKNVIVESNDVLFNITGASVCRCSIVPIDVLPARVNQHVSILRAIKEKLNPSFLSHLLISENVKLKLLGVGSFGGAVMEAITKEQLEKFEIVLPPITLQNRFVERIHIIEQQKSIAQKSLEKSEALFNSLLQKAFKGELV